MGYIEEREFWRGVDKRINSNLRPYLKHQVAEVMEIGSGGNTGMVRVRLPGENLLVTDLPFAEVHGSMPAVEDQVYTVYDSFSRHVVMGGVSTPAPSEAGGGAGISGDVQNYGAVGRGYYATGNTTSGSNVVSSIDDTSGFTVGRWVQVYKAAPYSDWLLARIRSKTSTSITLEDAAAADKNASATQTAIGITQVHVGSITSGTNTLAVDNTADLVVGNWVCVDGALGGQTLVGRIRTIASTTITLEDAGGADLDATTTVTNALVDPDSTAAINEALQAEPFVYLSAAQGGYRTTAIIDLPNSRVLAGAGFAGRIVKASPRDSFEVIQSVEQSTCRNITVNGIAVQGCWDLKQPVNWTATTAKSLGDQVRVSTWTATSATGWVFRATVAGTTGGTEPNWDAVAPGATVTDGGVTWQKIRPAIDSQALLIRGNADIASVNEEIKILNYECYDWAGNPLRVNGGNRVQILGCKANNIARGFTLARRGSDVIIAHNVMLNMGDDCIALNSSDSIGDYQHFAIIGNVVSSRSDAEFGAGVKVSGSKKGVVSGNHCFRNKNAGIIVQSDNAPNTPEEVVVVGNTVTDGKSDGIELQADDFEGITIVSNIIANPDANGINVHSFTNVAGTGDDLHIDENRIKNAGNADHATACGIELNHFAATVLTSVSIKDNKVRRSSGNGINVATTVNHLTVSGNEVLDSSVDTIGSDQIKITDADRFICSDNLVTDLGSPFRSARGIRIESGCTNGLVADNFALNSDHSTATSGISNNGAASVTVQGNKTT